MDKSILIEYADMKEEIKDLRRRIEETERRLDKLSNSIVGDVVNCGKKGKKPLGTAKVQGVPYIAISKTKALLKNRVRKMEGLELELLELTNQVEEYIEQIGKSELRTMFRLYYIDDLNWLQVAQKMNRMYSTKRVRKPYTEDSCRCKHNRFLEKNDKTTGTTV